MPATSAARDAREHPDVLHGAELVAGHVAALEHEAGPAWAVTHDDDLARRVLRLIDDAPSILEGRRLGHELRREEVVALANLLGPSKREFAA